MSLNRETLPSNVFSGQGARISTMLYTQDGYQVVTSRLVSVSVYVSMVMERL